MKCITYKKGWYFFLDCEPETPVFWGKSFATMEKKASGYLATLPNVVEKGTLQYFNGTNWDLDKYQVTRCGAYPL